METKILRKPSWLKINLPKGKNISNLQAVSANISKNSLNTVCEEALCPNKSRCWGSGTATFMLMGSVCTRNCGFCNVKSGKIGEPLDADEPRKVVEAIKQMNLNYVVLTSVDRDDLPDKGAGHFAKCVAEIKKELPKVKIELLIPDFSGEIKLLKKVVDSRPDVIGHNLEVVESLQRKARDARAGYDISLGVLHNIKKLNPQIFTKSSLMLGLGEKEEEILKAMDDLRSAGVDLLTVGQYLQPSKANLPVAEYISPKSFTNVEIRGIEKGFKYVISGPFVRSSFLAGEHFNEINIQGSERKTAKSVS